MYSMSYNYIISQYLIEHIGAQFCSLPWDSHEMYGIYLHCQVQLGPSGKQLCGPLQACSE